MFPHPRVVREGTAGHEPQPSDPEARTDDMEAATVERLSLMELVVAELGGWASAICYRCHLPAGPFLASDGVVHMDLALFRRSPQEPAEPSAPR